MNSAYLSRSISAIRDNVSKLLSNTYVQAGIVGLSSYAAAKSIHINPAYNFMPDPFQIDNWLIGIPAGIIAFGLCAEETWERREAISSFCKRLAAKKETRIKQGSNSLETQIAPSQ